MLFSKLFEHSRNQGQAAYHLPAIYFPIVALVPTRRAAFRRTIPDAVDSSIDSLKALKVR
jgi:hypothetical protein